MSDGGRLDSVSRMARRREEEAARALQASNRLVADRRRAEALLAEAHSAQRAGLNDALDTGAPGYRLKLLGASLRTVERALEVMREKLAAAERERAATLSAWIATQARSKAIDNASARRRAVLRARRERAAERDVEDRSARPPRR